MTGDLSNPSCSGVYLVLARRGRPSREIEVTHRVIADLVACGGEGPQFCRGKEARLIDPAGDHEVGRHKRVSCENRERIRVTVLPAVIDSDRECLGRRLYSSLQIVRERGRRDGLPARGIEPIELRGEGVGRDDKGVE